MSKASKAAKKPEKRVWPSKGRREDYDPDSLKVALPFGNIHPGDLVTKTGQRFRVNQFITPDIDARLEKLRQTKQLGPTVKAIKELAASKHIDGKSYLDDWELRARLAEAELFALYTAANTLPRKALRMRAKHSADTRLKNNPEHTKAKARWVALITKNPEMRRRDVLKQLEKEFVDIEGKKLARWVDAWKKELRDGK